MDDIPTAPPGEPETPSPFNTRARGLAAQAERRARAREALERGRRKLSWAAMGELSRRLASSPEAVKDETLVQIAKLDQGDRDKSLTLRGDPARPLVIGLAPARELGVALPGEPAPLGVARLPAPDPAPLVNGNAIIPQRFSLTDVAAALRAKQALRAGDDTAVPEADHGQP